MVSPQFRNYSRCGLLCVHGQNVSFLSDSLKRAVLTVNVVVAVDMQRVVYVQASSDGE